jgi:hypothetical protein
LSFLEIRAERRQKFISVEFCFATVFAFLFHVSAANKSFNINKILRRNNKVVRITMHIAAFASGSCLSGS